MAAGLLFTGCGSPGTLPSEVKPSLEQLEFRGNASIGRGELMKAIADDLTYFASDGIDKADVDDLAYGIELHYRSRGFPDAYVHYEYHEPTSTPARAELLIQEGPRCLVGSFEIRGNQAPDFTLEKLEPLFFPNEGTLFGDARRWYVRSELESARNALSKRYLDAGYLRVVLGDLDVSFTDPESKHTAMVSLVVDEGPCFRLTRAEIAMDSGDVTLAPEDLDSLREVHTDNEGDPLPYTPRLAQALRVHLLELLGRRAYPDAEVLITPVFDEVLGQVVVELDVDPGPRVTIAGVEFRGNEKTRASFLRNLVTLHPGDAYDLDALRDSFRRLFATRLFQRLSLELEPVPGAASGERLLVIEVTELPSREVYLEPGYGSYEGPRIKLGAVDKNLLGSGRSIQGEATLSTKYQRFVVGISDRALFNFDMTGSTSAFVSRRDEPSFTFEELGAGVDLSWAWPRHALELALGYSFRRTEVVDVEVQSPELSQFLSQIDISSLALTLAHDTRDHLFLPASGSHTRLRVEWADRSLGSEVNFLAGEATHSRFLSVPWEGAVIGLGLSTGLIAPVAGQPGLPLQVRLFNGGATSVRSFDQSELGREDANGEALGGQAYSVVSLELRQELLGNLSGALFYDAGNLEPNYWQYFEFNGMRQALGVGLRYLLPIGPARVDFGVNPDPQRDEDDWALHFAVGLAF